MRLGSPVVVFMAIALGTFRLPAQSFPSPKATLTITAKGAYSKKIISGTDPAMAAGKAGQLTLSASESLSPISHTATSATYKLPDGAVTAVLGGGTYQNSGPAHLKYTIPANGSDLITVSGPFKIGMLSATITGTISLAAGSLKPAVLKHPGSFTPSTQSLKAATTAKGPGSKVSYFVFNETTILGLSGTASSK